MNIKLFMERRNTNDGPVVTVTIGLFQIRRICQMLAVYGKRMAVILFIIIASLDIVSNQEPGLHKDSIRARLNRRFELIERMREMAQPAEPAETMPAPAQQLVPTQPRHNRYEIGDVVRGAADPRNNGLVYGGLAADGRHLLVDPHDAMDAAGQRLRMTFNDAADYAQRKGMELPLRKDLNLLYFRCASIPGFSRMPSDWYCSASADHYSSAWIQRFSDGYQTICGKYNWFYVRCVRRCSII